MTSDRRNSIVSLGIKSKRGGGGGSFLSHSVLRESIMIPPPVSGLSVDSEAGAPPSAPAGIVNAGGFFFDMIFFPFKYQAASSMFSREPHTITL